MPGEALREAYRQARAAFARYLQLKAETDASRPANGLIDRNESAATRTRLRLALREYVQAHARYTRLFDKQLHEDPRGAIALRPGEQPR